ncbi:LPS export ABC transporter periplasmic protein LptC [Candidatus Pelagibacter sp.]|jgi:lipopolysaccharide assembly outer membrane protein LptD (OstA)|nr:LPS export ABC transporter periplasmic protein LptC [Candidatus Pelagibacter sp.]|tara:strand:+ start:448 stop:1023 length:576 start_codon:yes stop_codon:yes gene_type:complete
MQGKTYIQILLLTVTIFLITITFYFYKFDQKKVEEDNKERVLQLVETSNTMENLSYSSKDNLGNEYKINAKKGSFVLANKDLILMEDVNAIITMNNSPPIIIRSDFADYNNKSYDTFFKDNISLNYSIHRVTAGKLDLLFKKNLVTMSDNLIYKNNDTILYADKFEMDLITKNNKIFMEDKSNKIKILISK